MDLDLRICFVTVGLSALIAALGGIFLLALEHRHACLRLRQTLSERADALSLAIQAKVEEAAGHGMSDLVRTLGTFKEEARGVASVFIWRRGHGLIWRSEGRGAFEESLSPDERWVTEGRKTRAWRRGWFMKHLATGVQTVGWTRSGPKDICGFVLEPNGFGPGENPKVLFGIGLCFVLLLGGILTAGPFFLWRCAGLARLDAVRKERFLSLVSHELRTPIASMLPNLEMLADGIVLDEEKRSQLLCSVQGECQRMGRMVSRLLSFCRLRRRDWNPSVECVDARRLVESVCTTMKGRFGTDELIVCGEPELQVEADADMLVESLGILLDNAAKYAAREGPVDVQVSSADMQTAVVRVMDRGPGIRHPGDLFRDFSRGEDARRVPGLGLGLAFGRELMRRMGGDLVFRPRDGGGSVFECRMKRSA